MAGQHAGGYGRGQNISSSLPPSGPMAMNTAWYSNSPAQSASTESGSPGELQQHGDGIGVTSNASTPADSNSGADPLSSLEPLRQNLPEVGSDGDKLK